MKLKIRSVAFVSLMHPILSLILMNSLFYQESSLTLIVTANTLLCILLGAPVVIMHPGGDFGKIDISGKM